MLEGNITPAFPFIAIHQKGALPCHPDRDTYSNRVKSSQGRALNMIEETVAEFAIASLLDVCHVTRYANFDD